MTFIQFNEGRAFIVLKDPSIENTQGEPTSIQEYLKDRKHIKLDQCYHTMMEGPMDDSVSQNPLVKQNRENWRRRQPKIAHPQVQPREYIQIYYILNTDYVYSILQYAHALCISGQNGQITTHFL